MRKLFSVPVFSDAPRESGSVNRRAIRILRGADLRHPNFLTDRIISEHAGMVSDNCDNRIQILQIARREFQTGDITIGGEISARAEHRSRPVFHHLYLNLAADLGHCHRDLLPDIADCESGVHGNCRAERRRRARREVNSHLLFFRRKRQRIGNAHYNIVIAGRRQLPAAKSQLPVIVYLKRNRTVIWHHFITKAGMTIQHRRPVVCRRDLLTGAAPRPDSRQSRASPVAFASVKC